MPSTSETLLLELKEISFAYPGGRRILDHLSLDYYQGERLGLVAPNGSGKTTLFHIIMGLLRPTGGEMVIFGRPMKSEKDFKAVRRRIGLLFQDADDQLFHPTVLEDVAFGPLNLGKSRQEAREIASRTLDFLGLAGFEDRITFKLSGGEKRLVSLATILAMEPEILLLDEPTTGLDEATKERLIHILTHLETSYIIVSHELDFLGRTTSKVYGLSDGRILDDEESSVLHSHFHIHPVSAVPHKHD